MNHTVNPPPHPAKVRASQPDLTIISLGAGVQSTVLALLACEGVLPTPDAAIFADTGWEHAEVYEHLDRLAVVLDQAGIPLHRVQYGNLRRDTVETTRFMRLPVFVQGQDGRAAMLRRQCTERYKLDPIKRQIRLMLGAQPHHPAPQQGRTSP